MEMWLNPKRQVIAFHQCTTKLHFCMALDYFCEKVKIEMENDLLTMAHRK